MYRARLIGPALLVLATAALAPGQGADVDDLQEELPTRLEDAIASQDSQWQGLARHRRTREGQHIFDFEPTLQWGLRRVRTHLQVSSLLIAGPGERTNSGDVQLLAFHQLNEERGRWPAFAVSLRGDAPAGKESAGFDTRLKGLMTKTLGTSTAQHRVHLNGSWLRNAGRHMDERGHLYAAVVGYSGLLTGNTILMVDVVREQQRQSGADLNLAELGMRRKVSGKAVVSLGVAVGFGPHAPRVQVSLGVEQSF